MSADDKIAEPHPLPLTRQWVEDYKRYGTGPKPVEGEQPKSATIPRDETGCPDLQALVERAGRRYARPSVRRTSKTRSVEWRRHPIKAATRASPPRNGPNTTERWRHGKQREEPAGARHD